MTQTKLGTERVKFYAVLNYSTTVCVPFKNEVKQTYIFEVSQKRKTNVNKEENNELLIRHTQLKNK